MIRMTGDWKEIAERASRKVDFHWSQFGPPEDSYGDRMGQVYSTALNALREAQEQGEDSVLFIHGYSTSRPGATTARSVIRGLMRSKESTPYVVKSKSIQHPTVVLAVIKPKRQRYEQNAQI